MKCCQNHCKADPWKFYWTKTGTNDFLWPLVGHSSHVSNYKKVLLILCTEKKSHTHTHNYLQNGISINKSIRPNYGGVQMYIHVRKLINYRSIFVYKYFFKNCNLNPLLSAVCWLSPVSSWELQNIHQISHEFVIFSWFFINIYSSISIF